MTHPLHHAQTSVKLWGGCIEDYLPIHDWFDSTKEAFCDYRHRALRHHSQGIFECERTFGPQIYNSEGHMVPVRYIAEQHVREDCGGRIPTVSDWFRNIKQEGWMARHFEITKKEPEGIASGPTQETQRVVNLVPEQPLDGAESRQSGRRPNRHRSRG